MEVYGITTCTLYYVLYPTLYYCTIWRICHFKIIAYNTDPRNLNALGITLLHY